jgi:cytochrome c2
VSHLGTRLDPARFSDAPFAGAPAAGEVERGKALFDELECRGCHVLDGDGDPVGPSLDGVGRRVRPGYAAALLLDPEGVVPGTSMTDFELGEDDAHAIARFLMTLE